jgi:release factor glutamine methyltransferase
LPRPPERTKTLPRPWRSDTLVALETASTVAQLLEEAARRIEAAGSTSARLDALLLLAHATGWSKIELLAHPERAVEPPGSDLFATLLARRIAHEPIAYILGEREFYGRTFRVDRRALIPRPETEALVEIGIEGTRRWRARGIEPTIVDVGTGSGAVAVSLAAETGERVVATERLWDPLTLARENACALGQEDRVRLVQADLVSCLRGPIHLLLANLPYMPRGRALPPDVQDYEPRAALFGGTRGTEILERLLWEARPLLAPGAEVALEIDDKDQSKPLASVARDLYADGEVEVRRDGAGLERVLWIGLRG